MNERDQETRLLQEAWFLRRRTLHSFAWTAWIAAIVVILTLTRNPFYLVLVITVIALVRWRCVTTIDGDGQVMVLSPLRFGLIVVTTASLFNMAMVHVGTTDNPDRGARRLPLRRPG
ncbi:MAG: hypothetical protein R6W76_23680 [Caldilinea sp.]